MNRVKRPQVLGVMAVLAYGVLTVSVFGQAQRGVWDSMAVQDLRARCGALEGSRVQLIGHVSTVALADATRADRYILNGYNGGAIIVQTTMERPLPTTHVYIRGTVNVDAMGDCFIVEAQRHPLAPEKVTPLLQDSLLSAIDSIAANPVRYGPDARITEVVAPPLSTDWTKIAVIGVAAILVVTAVIILLIVAFKPKPQRIMTPPTGGGFVSPAVAGVGGPSSQPLASPESDDEITIVRKGGEVRQNVDEKTVIPLPGWLEVLTGGQPVGSRIRLIGPQHSLIGRKSKGSSGVNFIGLEMDDVSENEKKTLSRKQLKIAYDKANDEFTAENIGSIGTAVRLDGGELAAGDSAPLTDGSTISLEPYWEFRFHKGRPA